jgi:hypothetical protein
MPLPKQYQNNAEHQAAYRARHPERKLPREDVLAALARGLHVVLQEAVQQPDCPLPAALVGQRADETLRNLIGYLDPHPDPVRYPQKVQKEELPWLNPNSLSVNNRTGNQGG